MLIARSIVSKRLGALSQSPSERIWSHIDTRILLGVLFCTGDAKLADLNEVDRYLMALICEHLEPVFNALS